jgi:hypothetical protein
VRCASVTWVAPCVFARAGCVCVSADTPPVERAGEGRGCGARRRPALTLRGRQHLEDAVLHLLQLAAVLWRRGVSGARAGRRSSWGNWVCDRLVGEPQSQVSSLPGWQAHANATRTRTEHARTCTHKHASRRPPRTRAADDERRLLLFEVGPLRRHEDSQHLVRQALGRDREVEQRHLGGGSGAKRTADRRVTAGWRALQRCANFNAAPATHTQSCRLHRSAKSKQARARAQQRARPRARAP